MSPLFGKKKSTGTTVLVLDIENGSVGAALVRLSKDSAPKLFSEKRVYVPALATRDSLTLVPRVLKATREALAHAADVAARVRLHPTMSDVGEVSRIIYFLHAPWVSVGIPEVGKVSLDAHEPFLEELRLATIERFDGTPISFQSFGSRIPSVVGSMFDVGDDLLMVSMTGEITEVTKARGGSLLGHATLPFGTHTFIRTLGSHAGMTEAEARSALTLLRHKGAHEHVPWGEAFKAASSHLVEESKDVIEALLREHTSPHGVYVLAPGPLAEWFAQTFANDERLASLFPEGSSARALHAHHAKPFLAVHATVPDVPLSLEALSIHARTSGI